MTLSLEFMDWLKLMGIIIAVVGNVAGVVYSVRSLKEEMRETNKRLDEFQKLVEKRIENLERELRYEITQKVDRKQYYDDVSGWRTDIRELRRFLFEFSKELSNAARAIANGGFLPPLK